MNISPVFSVKQVEEKTTSGLQVRLDLITTKGHTTENAIEDAFEDGIKDAV